MKMNMSLMKLTIRLLILMIFFVIIYLISIILFSTRYWPDVYNYINANITIKRIPTLSELNLTVIEVDFTTEFYTINDEETSTVEGFDFEIDEFTMQREPRTKRNAKLETFENDYNELPTKGVVVDYFFLQEDVGGVVWKRIVKDLIDESKLVPKNLGDVEMVNRNNGKKLLKLTNICHGNTSDITNIYPWIATIFIKNDTSNQFQYTCDGAVLSEKLLLTAARCLTVNSTTVRPDDVLVFLGKTSLQHIGVDEKNVRISEIKLHSNFTYGEANDLALLTLEDPVLFSDSIRPACLRGDGDEGRSATTAWDLSGALKPVIFEKNNNDCHKQDISGTFCATYGNNVALCPSYGGLHVSQRASRWYLHGIRTDDPGSRGICFQKTVRYTPVEEHLGWIMENME